MSALAAGAAQGGKNGTPLVATKIVVFRGERGGTFDSPSGVAKSRVEL